MVAPLKIRNGYVIPAHTFLGIYVYDLIEPMSIYKRCCIFVNTEHANTS